MSFLYGHRSVPSRWQGDVADIKTSELEAIETIKGEVYFLKKAKKYNSKEYQWALGQLQDTKDNIIGVPKREGMRTKKIFLNNSCEIFSKFGEDYNKLIWETHWSQSRRNMKKTVPNYIIIKLLKTSDKVKKNFFKQPGGEKTF